MQCWVDERGVALTEMVVYFATGNLPPKLANISLGQLCKGGAGWSTTFQEGTFISLGADPETPLQHCPENVISAK